MTAEQSLITAGTDNGFYVLVWGMLIKAGINQSSYLEWSEVREMF